MRIRTFHHLLSITLLSSSVLIATEAHAFKCDTNTNNDDRGDDNGYTTAVVCGNGTYASNQYSTAVGYNAKTNGRENTALGAESKAGMEDGLGGSYYHTAVGVGAEAGAGIRGIYNSTAIGYFAKANTSYAVALGANAEANFVGSMALGGVQTTRDNQVAIGNGNNSYTLAGLNSDASKAAQDQAGPKYMVTSDANGNLATSTFDVTALEALPARVGTLETTVSNQGLKISAVEEKNGEQDDNLANHEGRIDGVEFEIFDPNGSIAGLDQRVTTNTQNIALLDNRVTNLEAGFQDLGNQISENRKEARGGTALALAAAGLRYDDRPEKLSVAGGVGHFKGLTGLSFGVGYATSESLRFNAAISGVPQNGDVGFSAGASWTLN